MTPTASASGVAAPPGVVAVLPGGGLPVAAVPGGAAQGAASLPDVGAVLGSLGLPPLPALPPLPPLPGLPPLPVLDLSALLKPLTDLLGAFGTADLAAASANPPAVATESLALPAEPHLRALQELVNIGYVRGIVKRLDQIETESPDSAAFVERLRALARGFRLDEMNGVEDDDLDTTITERDAG